MSRYIGEIKTMPKRLYGLNRSHWNHLDYWIVFIITIKMFLIWKIKKKYTVKFEVNWLYLIDCHYILYNNVPLDWMWSIYAHDYSFLFFFAYTMHKQQYVDNQTDFHGMPNGIAEQLKSVLKPKIEVK